MIIADPIIELLAIKLYEHDSPTGYWPPPQGNSMNKWMRLADEDRQIYRDFASGKQPLP